MPPLLRDASRESWGFRLFQTIVDLLDIPVIFASLCLAYWIRFHSGFFEVHLGIPPFAPYLKTFAFVSLLWFGIFSFAGLYKNRVRFGIEQVFYIVRTVLLATAAVLAAVFFYRDFSYSRLTVVISILTTTSFVSAFHMLKEGLKSFLRRYGIGLDRVLIIGSGELGVDCYKRLDREKQLLGYDILGLCGDEDFRLFEGDPEIKHLGGLDAVERMVVDKSVSNVFLALPPASQKKALPLLKRLEDLGVRINIVPNIYSIITSSIHITDVAGMPVVRLGPLPIHGWGGVVKAVFDRVIALLGLILLSPLYLLVALLIKFDSKGPILYSQERVGLDGKPFTIYKFRSMKVDAEQTTGPIWATQDDPRKTRLGEFIRKYSIDELPQLWNVLIGDMSLVGPRPERPFFVEKFEKEISHYMDRHVVKTGITGWAQVNGLRGRCPIEERTRYDIWYIENWSLWLDILIIFRTFYVVFFKPTGF